MFKHSRNIIGVVAASLALLAASANAQDKGHEKGKGHDNGDKHDRGKSEHVANGNVDRNHEGDRERDRNNSVYVNRSKLPPGLARKPGGMPPGQYKKLYPAQGVTVLRDVFVSRGYTVVRTTPYGQSQYVYYRMPNGTVQRAVVSPGVERLTFTNVPEALLREILARLY